MRTGKCLCGEVSLEAEPVKSTQVCHCSHCRKHGGGLFMAVRCEKVSLTGPVKRYRSSEWGERGFCETCGSTLFFHPIGIETYAIPIALFDDQSGLPFEREIYIDDKPDYYAFENDTKKLTGAEFLAELRGRT